MEDLSENELDFLDHADRSIAEFETFWQILHRAVAQLRRQSSAALNPTGAP